MSIKYCRLCSHKLPKRPILVYKNMPQGAQSLLNKNDIKKDKTITLKVYQCHYCGLVQLDNEPVSYYKRVIRSANISKEMMEFRKKQFYSFISEFNLQKKKIVEIGCGKGEYLKIMTKFAPQSFGIEFDSKSVKFCNESGLVVYKDFIDSEYKRLPNSPYDAFFILNFLEHFPAPNQVLAGICNNLNYDGIGLIEVPNFDMILKNNLFAEFIIDHLSYFTKDTLRKLLEINGFTVIKIKSIWHNYILSAIVKKNKNYDFTNFILRQEKIKEELINYLQTFNKVAIWGASHQAFTIISLFNIKKYISFIIDSSPFKQKKYSPTTHLPIVHPDILKTKKIQAVVVIAGSYSMEIVKLLQKKYKDIKNISMFGVSGLKIIL